MITDPTTALTIATLIGLTTYAAGHLALDAVRFAVRRGIASARWHRSEPDPESVRRMAARIRAQLEADASRPPATLDPVRDADAEKRAVRGRAR